MKNQFYFTKFLSTLALTAVLIAAMAFIASGAYARADEPRWKRYCNTQPVIKQVGGNLWLAYCEDGGSPASARGSAPEQFVSDAYPAPVIPPTWTPEPTWTPGPPAYPPPNAWVPWNGQGPTPTPWEELR